MCDAVLSLREDPEPPRDECEAEHVGEVVVPMREVEDERGAGDACVPVHTPRCFFRRGELSRRLVSDEAVGSRLFGG